MLIEVNNDIQMLSEYGSISIIYIIIIGIAQVPAINYVYLTFHPECQGNF